MNGKDEFFCMNCKKILPEYFTICGMDKTDEEGSFKYVENQVHIAILKNQRINMVCLNCKEETFAATPFELQKIELKKLKVEPKAIIPDVFQKFIPKLS